MSGAVLCFPAAPADAGKTDMVNVLYEDNHLLVVEKPVNIPVQADSSGDRDLLTTLKEYIRENYAQELNLRRLSRHFALSESCLSRKFKAVAGVGISEYITNVRIHHAALLLTETNLSITEVASRCGYNDSNYFAAVFKKIKGITPLKYSRSNM